MAYNSNRTEHSNRSSSQPMMSGLMDTAKQRPVATAAAVGGAVAAGAFLWSRRDQISGQFNQMSGQVSEWSEKMRSKQGNSSKQSARSGSPMGAETGLQPELAGAGTSSVSRSARATGGRSGKAQSGQSMSPSRDSSPTPSL